MGKSYKKTPIIKDNGKSKKKEKRIANHTVRSKLKNNIDFELADGKSYKKVFDTWDIADYKSRWTEREARVYYYKHCSPEFYSWQRDPYQSAARFKELYPTVEIFLQKCWAPYHKRK